MLTSETKSIIDKSFEQLLNDMEKSVLIGVTESISPNDIEYHSEISKAWEDAIEYLESKLKHYLFVNI